MRPSQNIPPPIHCLCFVCRKTLVKEQLQSEKQENAERKENCQARQNNNTLAIKPSQGPLVLPQEQ